MGPHSERDLSSRFLCTRFTALTLTVFHGTDFIREVQPDYVNSAHVSRVALGFSHSPPERCFCRNSQIEVFDHGAGKGAKCYYERSHGPPAGQGTTEPLLP